MQAIADRNERARSVRDLLEMGFRHKWKASLFLLTVVATTTIILAFAPGEYTSTAKLMVRRGREGIYLDPSTTTSQILPIYKEWESEINTELEILGSRELVIEVIRKLGPDLFTRGETSTPSGILQRIQNILDPMRKKLIEFQKSFGGFSAKKSDGAEHEQVGELIRMIEKYLVIEAPKKSDIITVTYTAASPELARQIVDTLVNVYLDKRIEIHRIPGAHQFFGQQADLLMAELKTAEESIRSIKNNAGISSLEDSRRSLRTSMETIRALQLENESALAAANARVRTLRSMLSSQTTESPIGKNGAMLDRTEHLDLQATLRTDEITQAALIAEAKALDSQFTQLQQELAEVNTLDSPLRNLSREQELLEDKYRKYSEDKEQSRINEELETRKISNVSIVQHATSPTQADPSGKLFKLLAALFIGMMGAIAIAFGANAMDPTLHSATDVSERFGLKTLMELPRLRNSALYFFIHPYDRKKEPKKRNLYSDRGLHKNVDDYFQELLFKLISILSPSENHPLVIGVISSTAGEGVSSIAANLATTFSRDDRFKKTLLLDASLQEPFGDMAEQMEAAPFTYQYVHNEKADEEPEDSSGGITQFTDHLTHAKKQGYNAIVVDLPPASRGGRAIRMAATLDGVILVIAAGTIPWRTALHTAEFLKDTQANLTGVVLNLKNLAMPQWLYRKL